MCVYTYICIIKQRLASAPLRLNPFRRPRNTYGYIYIYAYIYIHIHTHMYVMCVYIGIYIYTYICIIKRRLASAPLRLNPSRRPRRRARAPRCPEKEASWGCEPADKRNQPVNSSYIYIYIYTYTNRRHI